MTRPDNDTFLRACRREPVPYTPVWLMRQAGRYLPEYRRVRERAGDFLSLCRSPEMATEVTLQPVDRLGVDAAILFSDILTIPAAMNRGLRFATGEGPVIDHPVRTAADVDALPVPDPGAELRYVPDAVAAVRKALNNRVPLIGFAGSPWTLATYMVEGGSSKTYGIIKRLAYDEPSVLHRLLDKLALAVTDYLNAQIEAGAQAVQIFDTWGGVLTPPAYRELSLGYMQRIVNGLHTTADGERVPVILFTKGGGAWLEEMAETGADVLGLDWQTDPAEARRRVGSRVALQGNMDPAVLYAGPERIRREVARTLDAFGPAPGHVFNLGHGVSPDVPPEHAEAFVAAVHELSAAR
ncbi:uroporphyrinogen decarboxylase [Thiohalorhabdus methylotrophus]|uniref:Uroporphyrinogen decarboxylase n=1 Tax=Thiohalorhabdus methylotrophus TaxID=3242694 RepID=A0ABV4TQ91_9GAMM